MNRHQNTMPINTKIYAIRVPKQSDQVGPIQSKRYCRAVHESTTALHMDPRCLRWPKKEVSHTIQNKKCANITQHKKHKYNMRYLCNYTSKWKNGLTL
jgi:hypothetical protein